jgi:hypothetical protein
MKKAPLVMIAGAALALLGLCALPWVQSDGVGITLLQIARIKDHGYQVAYVILGTLVVGLFVGVGSLGHSRRWQTAIGAVALLIPTFMSAVVKHGGIGARLGLAGAAVALVASIAVTVKPVRA